MVLCELMCRACRGGTKEEALESDATSANVDMMEPFLSIFRSCLSNVSRIDNLVDRGGFGDATIGNDR